MRYLFLSIIWVVSFASLGATADCKSIRALIDADSLPAGTELTGILSSCSSYTLKMNLASLLYKGRRFNESLSAFGSAFSHATTDRERGMALARKAQVLASMDLSLIHI